MIHVKERRRYMEYKLKIPHSSIVLFANVLKFILVCYQTPTYIHNIIQIECVKYLQIFYGILLVSNYWVSHDKRQYRSIHQVYHGDPMFHCTIINYRSPGSYWCDIHTFSWMPFLYAILWGRCFTSCSFSSVVITKGLHVKGETWI